MAIFFLSRAVIGSKIEEKDRTGIQIYGLEQLSCKLCAQFPSKKLGKCPQAAAYPHSEDCFQRFPKLGTFQYQL